jgi:predicted dehydrogenase
MGHHHTRVLQTLPDVEFVAAVDPRDDVPRGSALRGLDVLRTVSELVRRGVDLCVVSTPTGTHEEVALELAEAGVATLIEKPVAQNVKSAQTILDAFERNGVVGCVG